MVHSEHEERLEIVELPVCQETPVLPEHPDQRESADHVEEWDEVVPEEIMVNLDQLGILEREEIGVVLDLQGNPEEVEKEEPLVLQEKTVDLADQEQPEDEENPEPWDWLDRKEQLETPVPMENPESTGQSEMSEKSD